MKDLGQFLLQQGWVTEAQLTEAVQRQQQVGGRLGTCFLETSIITEARLEQALGELLEVPAATAEELRTIPPEVIALLPAKAAVNCRAVPFRLRGTQVDLAFLDVGDLTLEDELSFIIGKRIRFHIATELRLVEALGRYYEQEVPIRFASLLERFNATPRSDADSQPLPTPQEESEPSPAPDEQEDIPSPPPGSPDPPKTVVSSPPPVRTSIPLSSNERAALAAATPEQFGDGDNEELFAERLVHAETSSEIGHALLGVLSDRFVRVLLFRVSAERQEVTGWLGKGPEIDRDWFRNYSVGLRQASVFKQLLDSQSFVGRLEALPNHEALARSWGGSLEHECLLLPIPVRGKLVSVVYGDRGSLGVADVDLVLTRRLVAKAAIAFERCILRRKLRTG
jgi:hypothetical protein